MGYLKTRSRPPSGQVKGKQSVSAKVRTEQAQCLIASTIQARRDMLSEAASRTGWEAVVCADAQNATAAARRVKFQLAWIDLDHEGKTPSGFRDLCQKLATMPGMLLAVCGHEGDPQEEVWARQLGVWLYLPGISTQHVEEICSLCEQAQLASGGTKSPR